MAFFQTAPTLKNQFLADETLRGYLGTHVPPDVLAEIAPQLEHLGGLAGGELFQLQHQDRLQEPTLTTWDPWGKRIDHIEVTPLWKRGQQLAAQEGLVAAAYDKKFGAHARIHQFAMVYLFEPSSDAYSCPLAMTDGAAKTLLFHGHPQLVHRAVPHLLSRDPLTMWTSGQWMTERTGGSDVGLSETVAKSAANGQFSLHGTKWFTSATTADMALTLARPEGNAGGGRGLALFYLERLLPDGTSNGIWVNRLKDKLGTRKLPTAELTLDGTLATPVVGTLGGVRAITPMLNVTRTWNAVCAAASLRRAVTLCEDYAAKRVAFGASLQDKPLHRDTLLGMKAEADGAFYLAFRTAELLGKEESGEATEDELELLRWMTPIAKLTTAKQAVATASEALECFGGAGYVEDTGLPRLLRDAQVLPIWEGTTNVLSLDVMRVVGQHGRLTLWGDEISRATRVTTESADKQLAAAGQSARDAFAHATQWLAETFARAPDEVEAGARRFALTLGMALELALLCEGANHNPSLRNSALRLARKGVDSIFLAE